jgi:AmmeMemoRadiSam system protein B
VTGKVDRKCAVCGQFYPADVGELRENLRDLIARVELRKSSEGRIAGIIAPHAGYTYSGLTAAHGYSLLRELKYSTVVIVSPSHREYFDGISVYPGDSYSTPLGVVSVDEGLRERLLNRLPALKSSSAGHREEHAIEVQLPFLQFVLGDFRFLPIVMGDQKREYCYALGEALGIELNGEGALLVASTDLSHYHPSDAANRLDAVVIDDVGRFDFEGLMQDIEFQRTEACGGGPTVAVMLALKRLGAKRMSILHHCNSGDITGDSRQVVGYLSAAAYA